ncbi:hypothetical protein Trydic_g19437 [Trypoxylus dichotomus]
MSDSENDEEVVEKQLKIVFLGEAHVGKSSIIRRFCYNEYSRSYVQTVGSEFYLKHLLLPSKKEITIRITDVGGSELKGTMLDKYLYNANIIVLVYDITSINSFEDLGFWVEAITSAVKCAPIVAVLGNKCDLEYQRAVANHRVNKFAKQLNILHHVTSAKTGESVSSSMVDIVARYLGIPLTRIEKEHQLSIIKAELIPTVDNEISKKAVTNAHNKSNSSIIPALQSRCTRFRFGPLSPEQILPRLNYVIDEENVKISEDGKKALLTLANGDMRKVLNVLQSTWLAYKDVTEDNVYNCVGHPLKTDIDNIVKWLFNDDIKTVYTNIKELKTVKGLALSDILTEVHTYVHRIELPYELLIALLDKMAQIQVRLAAGSSENIQLTALISAFYFARDINI